MSAYEEDEALREEQLGEAAPVGCDGDAGADLGGSAAEQWTAMLNRTVNGVVVIKTTQTRAFDTEAAGSSYATGFVVDKQLGIVLTNRHVITPGPVIVEVVFQTREEVRGYPLYYDPVHDFGLLRYDPAALRFSAPPEIPLAPEAAAVGLEVRVVGNDSGERLSILGATVARMDRDAPRYGSRAYNDFNTWYLQAASGTKGGSSGSPVLDVHGRAVALNAGGKTKASSAYYLPLWRVVRALGLARRAARPGGGWAAPAIPRGDLQATFAFKGFDEVRRLGLGEATEAAARAAQLSAASSSGGGACPALAARSMGLLVVESVVPGGPSDGLLEPGDVLVRLDGAFVSDFLPMEALLDDRVGGSVRVEVERGGRHVAADVAVADLHGVTPRALLELGGGAVNALSYQQARNNRAATGQVYVAEAGYLLGKAGVPRHAVITSLAGRPTLDLPAFTQALSGLAHGARAPLEFFTFDDRFRRRAVILDVDWNWYGPPVRWERDDAAGVWQATTEWPLSLAPAPDGLGAVEASETSSPRISSPRVRPCAAAGADAGGGALGGGAADAAPIPRQHSMAEVAAGEPLERLQAGVTAQCDDARLALAPADDGGGEAGWRVRLEGRLRAALVAVDVEIPLVALADGVYSRSFAGCGVVVHHSSTLGLVAVDRNTVAIGCGDVLLSFGAFPAEAPARVRFLHPLHNFALLSYDPRDLSSEAATLVRAAELRPAPPLARGESVELVCLSKSLRVLHRTSTVTNPAMAALISPAEVPRFRAVQGEVIKLDMDFGLEYSGVLSDRAGRVRALWASYSEQVDKEEREWTAGLPAALLAPWVERVLAQLRAPAAAPPPAVPVLDAELEPLLLSKAAQFGLPAAWVARLVALDPERRQVLRVRSTVAGSPAAAALRDGDMVLAVGGRPVSSFGDVERAVSEMGNSVTPASPAAPDAQGGGGAGGGEGGGEKRAAGRLALTVFRSGAVIEEVLVGLGLEDGLGTARLVHWCGAQLQAPHRAVRELGFVPPGGGGVYISRWHHGSPAHRYSLYALHWITEVNGRPVRDLDAFLAAVAPLGDGDAARLKLVHFETTKEKMITLKTDLRFWPTWKLRLDPARGEWTRVGGAPPR